MSLRALLAVLLAVAVAAFIGAVLALASLQIPRARSPDRDR